MFPDKYTEWLEENGYQSAQSGHLKDENGEELNPSGKEALMWEDNY